VRLGLIARADNSGLGVQTWELFRNLKPIKTLVIDVGHLYNTTDHCNNNTFRGRYPGALFHNDWSPPLELIAEFLWGLDVVFTCETPYNFDLYTLAKRKGVKTVLQPNVEFFANLSNPYLPQPDVYAMPTRWRWDEIHFGNKVLLPVPIATDRFTEPQPSAERRNFLHVVGRPAVHDRNGTPDLLAALQHVKTPITVTLKCQDANYLNQLTARTVIPPHVEMVADTGDVENYWDNYTVGDVLIMPRRFGGLCLPVNEALGAGMPVIMTDIDPNNTWLPPEWLVPARKINQFHAMTRVDVYQADPVQLAAKIDLFATDETFYAEAKQQASDLAKQFSWAELKPLYQAALTQKH
jgi:glycosyltransferase involved in cell wall biosynthesis